MTTKTKALTDSNANMTQPVQPNELICDIEDNSTRSPHPNSLHPTDHFPDPTQNSQFSRQSQRRLPLSEPITAAELACVAAALGNGQNFTEETAEKLAVQAEMLVCACRKHLRTDEEIEYENGRPVPIVSPNKQNRNWPSTGAEFMNRFLRATGPRHIQLVQSFLRDLIPISDLRKRCKNPQSPSAEEMGVCIAEFRQWDVNFDDYLHLLNALQKLRSSPESRSQVGSARRKGSLKLTRPKLITKLKSLGGRALIKDIVGRGTFSESTIRSLGTEYPNDFQIERRGGNEYIRLGSQGLGSSST